MSFDPTQARPNTSLDRHPDLPSVSRVSLGSQSHSSVTFCARAPALEPATKQPVEIMDKLQPIFDLIEGCDPKVSALAGVGALIVAKFALNVSGTFSR